ncbi:hypothetical protein [Bradyrhizobium neotropicale]|uniref:Uncharacterized protein n=1 Tax=Bradyrhizobium neotropicale TaxID=1497615 RepID=A0A176Z126_9BRAD|nr:hypothetical protein [Bradyrhizobium neotropicale]OAF14112.1 hypothetical protein AXW67_00515 [Bradyrhizobium neotropicale]
MKRVQTVMIFTVMTVAVTYSAEALAACNHFRLTFNNGGCVQMNSSVLMGYTGGAEAAYRVVKPAPPANGINYDLEGANMTEWRFVATTNYSDRPENSDIAMIDTGKRAMKATCTQDINCHHGN